MPQVNVVARIKARSDAVQEVKNALLKLVEPTLNKDDGCISYDLYQDNDNPSLFFFLEKWESEELLEKHLNSEHIKAYRKAAEGLIEQRDMYRLSRVA